eukprot:459150-Pyramimonas_sp.AAC.1
MGLKARTGFRNPCLSAASTSYVGRPDKQGGCQQCGIRRRAADYPNTATSRTRQEKGPSRYFAGLEGPSFVRS